MKLKTSSRMLTVLYASQSLHYLHLVGDGKTTQGETNTDILSVVLSFYFLYIFCVQNLEACFSLLS